MTAGLPLAALLLLVLAAPAFWPAYLSKLPAAERYTHVHAVLGTAWLLLLIVQPLLLRHRRVGAHRLVGRVGVVVGAGFVVSGLLVAHRSLVRMSPEQFAREGGGVYLPLMMTGLFAAAGVLAIRWRKVPALHGRFMACTGLALLDPLTARLLYFHGPRLPIESMYQVPAFGVALVTLALLTRSLGAQTAHRAPFQRFAVGVAVALALFFVVPHSTAWLGLVGWFRSLPLT